MQQDEHSQRVVVVTGASRGIGRATVELFARSGARVSAFARTTESLEELAKTFDGSVLAVAGDVADDAAVEELFCRTEDAFGACEVLVNAAGMIHPAKLHETTPADLDRLLAVNLRSAFMTIRRALPRMIENRRGAIVNVASISGVPGPDKFPGYVSYAASKGGLISLTDALAAELRGTGVRANCVSPGSVDTVMWSEASGGAPAAMSAPEVAEAISFLASERSRPMNGQNLCLW